jgi:hypothetical protein
LKRKVEKESLKAKKESLKFEMRKMKKHEPHSHIDHIALEKISV